MPAVGGGLLARGLWGLPLGLAVIAGTTPARTEVHATAGRLFRETELPRPRGLKSTLRTGRLFRETELQRSRGLKSTLRLGGYFVRPSCRTRAD